MNNMSFLKGGNFHENHTDENPPYSNHPHFFLSIINTGGNGTADSFGNRQ